MAAISSSIRLSATDVTQIARLYGRCVDYFDLQDGISPTLADADDLFTDVPAGRSASDQIVLGRRGEGELRALAAVLPDYPDSGIWYLGFMLVDAAYRGSGLGKALYRDAEALAMAAGAREVRLAVLERNGDGLAFWRTLGFRELRRVGPDTFKTRSHYRIELYRRILPFED